MTQGRCESTPLHLTPHSPIELACMTLLMFRARLIFQSIICQELEIIKMCNIVINIIFIFQFLDAFLLLHSNGLVWHLGCYRYVILHIIACGGVGWWWVVYWQPHEIYTLHIECSGKITIILARKSWIYTSISTNLFPQTSLFWVLVFLISDLDPASFYSHTMR